MNEPVSKQRPTVDLDDFERQMRDAQHYDDPLAELARLVGEQSDPYGDVFAREAAAPVHAASDPYQAQYRQDGRREPDFEAQPAQSPRFSGDFAAIEAGLRGRIPAQHAYAPHHAEPTFEPRHDQAAGYDHAQDFNQGYAEPAAYDPAWQESGRAAPRARRPVYLLAATIAVGVIGIGTAFALKGHIATSPREVKTILADESPTKVQPPADAATDAQANQDAAVLGNGQPAPTALASHAEQPVDLLQAARDNAAAQAARTNADSVPVPPSPGQIQTALADPTNTGSQSFPGTDIAPKRVRVVSVRPDGTILPNSDPAPAAMPAPRAPAGKTSDRAGPVAKPTPAKTSKSTSRVTTPKSIDQLASAPDEAAPAPAPRGKKPKPQRVASRRHRRGGGHADDLARARGVRIRRFRGAARRARFRGRCQGDLLAAGQEVRRPARGPSPRVPQGREQRKVGVPGARQQPEQARCGQPLRKAEGRRRQLLRR